MTPDEHALSMLYRCRQACVRQTRTLRDRCCSFRAQRNPCDTLVLASRQLARLTAAGKAAERWFQLIPSCSFFAIQASSLMQESAAAVKSGAQEVELLAGFCSAYRRGYRAGRSTRRTG